MSLALHLPAAALQSWDARRMMSKVSDLPHTLPWPLCA
jgi:hypothetical protein